MKKVKFSALLTLLLLCTFAAEAVENSKAYTLEKVVVFSRHGLRAPLATPSSSLGKMTPDLWPQWDTPPSYLTTRGGVLEAYFGHYFGEWLVDNGLLKEGQCPSIDEVYIYTNSLQRTIATGQYFSAGAFPGCLTPTHHKEKMGTMDPVFNPIITNNSDEFKQKAIASMNEVAGTGGVEGLNKKLLAAYKDMMDVINYSRSANCLNDKQCDITKENTMLRIEAGKEPGITGPLRIGTSVADAFILQYYEGSPLKDVAWGRIKNDKQFETLVSIKENYNTVIFGAPVVAKEVSRNLVTYINNALLNKDQAKFTFLVGHDSNFASMFANIGIKPYILPNQFETTPIGGKVLFEKWINNATGEAMMKIEYLYQSTDQLRKLEQLNRNNQPQRVVLEMAGCPINAQGFCSFEQFEQTIQEVIK